jgi:hypothetical protein
VFDTGCIVRAGGAALEVGLQSGVVPTSFTKLYEVMRS